MKGDKKKKKRFKLRKMDAYVLKNIFTFILILGALATAAGTIGTIVFSIRVEKCKRQGHLP